MLNYFIGGHFFQRFFRGPWEVVTNEEDMPEDAINSRHIAPGDTVLELPDLNQRWVALSPEERKPFSSIIGHIPCKAEPIDSSKPVVASL